MESPTLPHLQHDRNCQQLGCSMCLISTEAVQILREPYNYLSKIRTRPRHRVWEIHTDPYRPGLVGRRSLTSGRLAARTHCPEAGRGGRGWKKGPRGRNPTLVEGSAALASFMVPSRTWSPMLVRSVPLQGQYGTFNYLYLKPGHRLAGSSAKQILSQVVPRCQTSCLLPFCSGSCSCPSRHTVAFLSHTLVCSALLSHRPPSPLHLFRNNPPPLPSASFTPASLVHALSVFRL